MKTQVDGFAISSELVSLLSQWKSGEMPEMYISELLAVQDYLSRLLGENMDDLKELNQLSRQINVLVGIRDELKILKNIFEAQES
jgi:hypothetical protein